MIFGVWWVANRWKLLSGNTGVSILLYEPRYSYSISRLERESGVKFEHISAPQPADVAESAGSEAADSISNVSDRYACGTFLEKIACNKFTLSVPSMCTHGFCSVVPVFRSQAEQLLSSSGLSAVDLLAKALAKAAVRNIVIFSLVLLALHSKILQPL